MKLFYFNIQEINDFKYNFLYNHSIHFLKKHEIQKINFFKTKKNKYICLVSLLLQYFVINKYCFIKLKHINIMKNSYGKPFLPCNNFFYNVSHIQDYVVILISQNQNVGIDIVYLNQNVNISAFKKHFSKKEFSNIKVKKTFFIYWSLKESFIKTIGTGISDSLCHLTFDFSNFSNIKLFIYNKLFQKWKFNIISFKKDYLITYCTEKKT